MIGISYSIYVIQHTIFSPIGRSQGWKNSYEIRILEHQCAEGQNHSKSAVKTVIHENLGRFQQTNRYYHYHLPGPSGASWLVPRLIKSVWARILCQKIEDSWRVLKGLRTPTGDGVFKKIIYWEIRDDVMKGLDDRPTCYKLPTMGQVAAWMKTVEENVSNLAWVIPVIPNKGFFGRVSMGSLHTTILFKSTPSETNGSIVGMDVCALECAPLKK